MALPTNGHIIVDTTAGEIDIELWSKVRGVPRCPVAFHSHACSQGDAKDVPELPSSGDGRSVACCTARAPRAHQDAVLPGYYDGVIFHR
jgi:cyclophilin family peptidyl-prolyl cis-trans isomerase